MASGGYMPLIRILTAVAGNLRHGVDSQPGFKAHATALVNRALEEAADAHEWPELRRNSDIQLTVEGDADTDTMKSGSSYFVAPWGAVRVDSVVMMTPTRYSMAEVSSDQLLSLLADSEAGTVGQPRFFAEWGRTAQHTALAAAGALTVLSDSTLNSSDQSNLRVVVTYRQAGHQLGQAVRVNVEGDFDTGVALPVNAVAGWPIESVSLPIGWAGSLVIQDASANEIVSIPRGLLPTSSASGTEQEFTRKLYRTEKASDSDRGGNMTWIAEPRPLVADSDTPDIPCASFLIEMATAMLYEARGNVVMARSHRSNAMDSLGGRYGHKKKRHKVAGPQFGNVCGSTGMQDF